MLLLASCVAPVDAVVLDDTPVTKTHRSPLLIPLFDIDCGNTWARKHLYIACVSKKVNNAPKLHPVALRQILAHPMRSGGIR